MAAPPLAEIFSTSPLKPLNSHETRQEARSQRPLPGLCFWVERKNKMAARPLIV